MPYIKREDRDPIDLAVCDVVRVLSKKGNKVGDLNFAITRLITYWIKKEKLSYTAINSAMGVLDCVSKELYRRVASGYEDVKRIENGDVYNKLFSK
jgi:hypothetical protein